MSHGRPSIHRLRGDRRGAGLVEYILLIGLIGLVALAGSRALGQGGDGKVRAHAACVASLSCGDGAGTIAAADVGAATGASTEATPLLGAARVDAPPPAPPAPAAPAERSIGQRALDLGKGFVVDGLWGTVTGLWTMVTHPIETLEGLAYVVSHPIESATAIKDAVVAAWDDNPERVIGAGIFEVVTLPVAALKATKASRLGAVSRVARTVDRVDDASDLVRAADRADDAADVARAAGASDDAARLAALLEKYDTTPGIDMGQPIKFGQANVSPRFSSGGLFKGADVDEVAARLRSGELSPDDLPVQYIWVNGDKMVVNNRSLTALSKAGLQPTRTIDMTGRLPATGDDSLVNVLGRLETMEGNKPACTMCVRESHDDWGSPNREVVRLPE
jgi:Flp pilus assembly pilin Flp